MPQSAHAGRPRRLFYADKRSEFQKKLTNIAETVLQYSEKLFDIDFPIDVDKSVPKASHLHQCLGEFIVKDALLSKDTKGIRIVLWRTKTVLGDKVIGKIERALYRNDQ